MTENRWKQPFKMHNLLARKAKIGLGMWESFAFCKSSMSAILEFLQVMQLLIDPCPAVSNASMPCCKQTALVQPWPPLQQSPRLKFYYMDPVMDALASTDAFMCDRDVGRSWASWIEVLVESYIQFTGDDFFSCVIETCLGHTHT